MLDWIKMILLLKDLVLEEYLIYFQIYLGKIPRIKINDQFYNKIDRINQFI
jgi:hypothetical protein